MSRAIGGTRRARQDVRGGIAVVFALLVVPLVLVMYLALEYGSYIQARAQLNLAADGAALYAVRTASMAYSNGYTTIASEQTAGQLAGQQWFVAQLGTLASVTGATPTVTVTYQAAPGTFTSTVSYTASLPTGFGGLIPASLAIAGTSSSTVQSGYLEVLMLVDNSSSMLIGSTPADMLALEQLTTCSTQSAGNQFAGVGTGTLDTAYYSWTYTGNYGYPTISNGYTSAVTAPPTASQNGSCASYYDGPANLCLYVPTVTLPNSTTNLINSSGRCISGGSSAADTNPSEPLHTPQAPCSFACHSSTTGNDYYALARAQTSPKITLRLDVVHSAAQTVIQALQADLQMINQFSVGYYEFNNSLTNVYPGTGEAGTNLATANSDLTSLDPPVTPMSLVYNTDFTNAINSLYAQVTPAGNGLSPTTPLKALFIVTDGLNDTTALQLLAPMTSATNETLCQKFKNIGFSVYVLYTSYLPFPAINYPNVKPLIEPSGSSSVELALKACASSAANYFPATDAAEISTDMQAMLKSALNTPGRISN